MTSFAHDDAQLAAAYERESELQFESGKRLLEGLALEASARVLDVGCGTGRLTRWLADELGAKAHAVDPLEPRIALARSHQTAARFDLGRAEDLRAFDDQTFDVACLSSVLHWVSDKRGAFTELHRVLRPGGRLAMTTLAHELSAASTIGRLLPRTGTSTRRACTTTELLTLLLENGFEPLELHVTQTTNEYDSGEAFVAFAEASSFGNLFASASADQRASLRAGLASTLGPNRVVMRGWSLSCVARRA